MATGHIPYFLPRSVKNSLRPWDGKSQTWPIKGLGGGPGGRGRLALFLARISLAESQKRVAQERMVPVMDSEKSCMAIEGKIRMMIIGFMREKESFSNETPDLVPVAL